MALSPAQIPLCVMEALVTVGVVELAQQGGGSGDRALANVERLVMLRN